MIKLICGLGNVGDRYLKTRHNAGFWLLDSLRDDSGQFGNWREEKKFASSVAKIQLANQAIYLQKPHTLMNASGRALVAMANFYAIKPEEILVVHDELDLPEGVARLKQGGGHGGHNGLRDCISALGSRDFYRLRLGIGRPPERLQVVDYVLKPPSKAGREAIDKALIDAERAIERFLKEGAEKAMTWLHSLS